MRKNKVVIGFLGTQLDSGKGAGRWEKWRPTVSLVQHEDVVIERLELLYTPPHRELAHQVRADMATASPETSVNLVPLPIADPWDFGEVYAQLYDWTQAYRFDTEREEYWTHITTGTHVAQICLFLLVESRRIPGVLVQTTSTPVSLRRPTSVSDRLTCTNSAATTAGSCAIRYSARPWVKAGCSRAKVSTRRSSVPANSQ